MTCAGCGTANANDATRCTSCSRGLGSFSATVGPAAGDAIDPGLTGRTLADRYVVTRELGKGGMGVVYGATDLLVRQEIAIKVLQQRVAEDHEELERFKRELLTSRSITHPNVIRIHDMGMLGADLFISMELLAGGTLADRLRRGLLPIGGAAEIAVGICEGLQAAHEQTVIHRDLKPQNVLFDAQNRPKIVDFGLARRSDATSRTVGFSGTPSYMSPEQADGAELGIRSDLYSLGVLLFEVFTGRLPFIADSLLRLVMMHAKETPPAPRSLRPDLPAEIETVLLRCLEKNAARRPASATAIAEVLRPFVKARGASPPAQPARPPVEPRRSRRATYAATGAVLVVAAVTVPFLLPVRDVPVPVNATPIVTATVAVAPSATPTARRTAMVAKTTPSPARTVAVLRPTATPAPTGTAVVAVATPARVVVGRLRVGADPECRGACWANVQLDGETRASPCEFELTSGTHTLVIDRPGSLVRVERTLKLENTGRVQVIEYRLVRMSDGTLKAISISG